MIIPDHLKPTYTRAKRRGMKELDIILGFVADKFLITMNKKELQQFNNLLDQEDHKIYKWIFNKEPLPQEFNNEVWQFVLSFDPSNDVIMS